MGRQEEENIREFGVASAPGNLLAEFVLGLSFACSSNWQPNGQASCVEDLLANSTYRVSDTEEECLFSQAGFLVRARRSLVDEKRKLDMVYLAKLGTAPGRELGFDVFVDLEPVYRPSLSRFGVERGMVIFQLAFPDGMTVVLSFVKGGVMVTLARENKATELAYGGGKWINWTVKNKFAHYLKPALVEIPLAVWLSLMGTIVAGELTGQTEAGVAREIEKKLFERVAFINAVLGK